MTYQAKIIVKVKHDNGTSKISTFAASIDEAIQNVIKSENCPQRAVIYAKVAPLTISDIKYLTQETAPYFFSRKTLQFFKQRVSDFKVTRQGNDKFYISAPRPYGKTKRVFNPFTRELEHI